MNQELGTLTRVDLREIWQNEASDFTPWLAQSENLARIGQTLNMNIELESREKRVGPFSADLLCRDLNDDSWVVIENQLDTTDHKHLGQLLTYTAGLEAVTIIWIAGKFVDEHRAALDWLNEKTPDGIAFFGLEVELWRIGDSPAAPKFNIVCRPNEWTRSVIKNRESSFDAQFCWDYWSGVFDKVRPSGILAEEANPFSRHDTRFNVGWRNFWLKAYFSRPNKYGAVQVVCRGPQGLENHTKIMETHQQIEQSCGHELHHWENEDRNAGALEIGLNDLDVDKTDDWPRQHELYAERVIALYRAVDPLVRQLDGETNEANDGQ